MLSHTMVGGVYKWKLRVGTKSILNNIVLRNTLLLIFMALRKKVIAKMTQY